MPWTIVTVAFTTTGCRHGRPHYCAVTGIIVLAPGLLSPSPPLATGESLSPRCLGAAECRQHPPAGPCCYFLPGVALVVRRHPHYLYASRLTLVCCAVTPSVLPSSSPPRCRRLLFPALRCTASHVPPSSGR
ncbi:hypothetical protein E2562_003116 [Oryza meyeriana var. granulata]|uniref:Uncharacterized protein n=1 Tax=Oryza meyeriana var. granulata TaxID=110450 RepID=A0A6G1E886_9ORYZ|nr:hypothetical protein E2562_003116 [Oryza meyeriana var. granulata]